MCSSSTDASVKKFLSCVQKCALKPLNKNNVMYYYSPLYGVACYGLLAVKVMSPASIFQGYANRDITNALLGSSIFGCSLYIYSRSHLQAAPFQFRLSYSVYGGLLYSFGSVLMWAVLRSLLPENKILAVTVGLVTAGIFTGAGRDYLAYVDKISSKP